MPYKAIKIRECVPPRALWRPRDFSRAVSTHSDVTPPHMLRPTFPCPLGPNARHTHTVRSCVLFGFDESILRTWLIYVSLSLSLFRVDRDSPVCTNCSKCGVISCEKKAVSLNYHRLINSTCSNKLDIKTCLTNHLWNVLIWQNRVHYFVPV